MSAETAWALLKLAAVILAANTLKAYIVYLDRRPPRVR
jgi:hypothetical protein